ncbi:MAG: substrate-binding domain-containing protein [Clostridiaceae bacterium]|nr:substrate-binding domain-containing protein [Clostridiaceae bacterium]
MKKRISLFLAAVLVCVGFAGCAKQSTAITVVSRESGSGTRGAFIELFGVEEKDADGNKVDRTVSTADIGDSTGVVMTSVAANVNAIGYISLGAVNDTVRALSIDGAAPTVDNVKNGSYKIARPFNIATKGELSALAADFIAYILSSDGQAIVAANSYIPMDTTGAYGGEKPSGKLVIAGSSSVTPLMEKLREAYLKINTNAEIEIQQSDSTSGMKSVLSGVCEIGMASRELKDSELSEGLTPTVIATDGIAVIVNPSNSVVNLTSAQVKSIYTGETTDWAALKG